MQRIFKELVLTEKAYVKDLASVMDVRECVCVCVWGGGGGGGYNA